MIFKRRRITKVSNESANLYFLHAAAKTLPFKKWIFPALLTLMFHIVSTHSSAPLKGGQIIIMSDLEYITRGKKQQCFVLNGLGGRMILVLISLFLSSKESSSKAYGKGNKTGHAQYETWRHLAPYNLIQISLFILFHYLILISALQMLPYINAPCMNLFFFSWGVVGSSSHIKRNCVFCMFFHSHSKVNEFKFL